MKGREFLYNLIVLSVFILGLPWILYQLLFVMKRRKGIGQRFGAVPRTDGPVIWCHAVSVGEVKAVQPMLAAMQADERSRDRIVLSTVTPTGQDTAARECGFAKSIFFFPLDLPFCVGKAIDRVRPELFITAETEIWPNFFFACFRRNIPVVIVNGRISDGSFSRYMRFRWFFRPILENVTAFLMQSGEDANRIIQMGAAEGSVQVTGNMKYDRTPEPVVLPAEIVRWAGSSFLLVAGSTHAGEEEIVIRVLKSLEGKNVRLALVPRHPERFDEVAGLLNDAGVSFCRFTDITAGSPAECEVVLVDAMGVLDGFYALADAAFVGGSLVPVGGHNLLEPAMHGVPVLTGPHIHNFREISRALIDAGGSQIVTNPEIMENALTLLLRDDRRRKETGDAARSVWAKVKGTAALNAEMIMKMVSAGE